MAATSSPCIVRVKNVVLLREHTLVAGEDLWFRRYAPGTNDRPSEVIDAQDAFWRAQREARPFAADVVIDGGGSICCPGYIDLQLNGAFGVDFTNGALTEEGTRRVAQGILAHGVTSFLPTVITSAKATYHAVLPVLRSVQHADRSSTGANILGLHLEGPFISPHKKGAHEPAYICPEVRSLQSIYDMYGVENMPDVRLITLAPELPGALAAIEGLTAAGVMVSIGHSRATIEEGALACQNGARKITHLFNAMSSFHHRDPGLLGLLGLSKRRNVHYGIIPDGFHAHPAAVKIAYDAHPSGAILVTDAMCAMGLPTGQHKLGTKEVTIVESQTLEGRLEKKAFLTHAPETLAGSVVSMEEGIDNFLAFTGCSIAEALNAASFAPAKALGLLHRKGSLRPGADADFVLLDPHSLVVQKTFVGGQLAYHAPARPSNAK